MVKVHIKLSLTTIQKVFKNKCKYACTQALNIHTFIANVHLLKNNAETECTGNDNSTIKDGIEKLNLKMQELYNNTQG